MNSNSLEIVLDSFDLSKYDGNKFLLLETMWNMDRWSSKTLLQNHRQVVLVELY